MTLPTRTLGAFCLLLTITATATAADTQRPAEPTSEPVDLFQAMEDGQVEVKFIAKSSRRGRVLIENKAGEEVNLRLPEAFAGVPVLAQGFGGGGGGGGFGGGGGGGGGQSTGGGFGGGGGGGLGGGGGQFSVAADKVAKLDVALLCLEHGKKDPTSSKPYKIVPVTDAVDRPAVIELLKAFGRGELHQGAAQAAAWNLNNDLSWRQLASKLAGTARDFNRSPYFSRNELQAAVAYAQESHRLASLNADNYRRLFAEAKAKHEAAPTGSLGDPSPYEEAEAQAETADEEAEAVEEGTAKDDADESTEAAV